MVTKGLTLSALVAATALATSPGIAAAHPNVHAAPADDTCTNSAGHKLQDQDTSDEQLPWQRKGSEEVPISFATNKVTAQYKDLMAKGVAEWDVSPCIKPRLVDTCQSDDINCVTVSLKGGTKGDDDGNFDADEKGGFTVGGHITYYKDKLAKEGPTATLNVVVHEMGHAVGLRHRKTPDVLMYEDTNNTTKPDKIDYQNLVVLYDQKK